MTPEQRLQEALDKAQSLGAAEAEAVLAREVALDIDVAEGQLENLLRAEAIGMGVRVFTGDRRMGFAYTTVLEAGADGAAERAWQNALANDPDPHNVLTEEIAASRDDWAEEDFARIPIAEKIDFCRALESKTRAADNRIDRIQEASYGDHRFEYTIMNSRGLIRAYQNADCRCSVAAAASAPGADSEMGWEFDCARTWAGLRPGWVAEGCAARATRALGGKPCASGAAPVVLDRYVATQFLGVLGPALMASNVLKGKSLFAGRGGETVASEHVSIVDQNDLDAGLNRAPFDGEGVSAQATVLIDSGVLRGFLHDTYTAHRMGVKTTANAGRGGAFRSAPEVGATNCYLKPGDAAPDELITAAGAGLWVTHAMGVHTADPISGDFSFGVAGLAIKNGGLAGPVRGVTVAGNIKDLLQDIRSIGNDLRFYGAYGSPSVLLEKLMVSGR